MKLILNDSVKFSSLPSKRFAVSFFFFKLGHCLTILILLICMLNVFWGWKDQNDLNVLTMKHCLLQFYFVVLLFVLILHNVN